MTKMIDNL